MDPKDQRSIGEKEEEVEELIESTNEKKCCTDCRTTSTPLWRGGPAGPKSLCNACGIKYNKKRRAQMNGFDKNGRRSANCMKMKLTVTDRTQAHRHHNHHHHHHHQQHQHQQNRNHHRHHQQHQQKRKRSSYERGKPWWNKLREEEQAAILLMAISCGGSLY